MLIRARWFGGMFIAAALLATCSPARAVITVDIPFSRIVEQSKQILIGTITAVDENGKAIGVRLQKDLKREIAAQIAMQRAAGYEFRQETKFRNKYPKPGDPAVYKKTFDSITPLPYEKDVRLDAAAEPHLLKAAKVGEPVVILMGRVRGAGIHVASTWCGVEDNPSGTPQTWTISKTLGTWWTFPGYTSDMVQALEELAAGTARVEQIGANPGVHDVWKEYRVIAEVKGAPKFIAAGDVDGNGVPDFLAGMEDRVELFVSSGGQSWDNYGVKQATKDWALSGVRAAAACFADANGDGKADLLLDDTLYVNSGDSLLPSKAIGKLPAGSAVLAVGFNDISGDGKPDALVLLRTGQLHAYENPGSTDMPWKARPPATLWQDDPEDPPFGAFLSDKPRAGRCQAMVFKASGPWRYCLDPNGDPPADFCRLTGQPQRGSHKGKVSDKMDISAVAYGHFNHEHCRSRDLIDYYVCTRTGDDEFTLVNRYFGMYFANGRVSGWRRRPPNWNGRGKLGAARITPVAMAMADIDTTPRSINWDELIFATEDGKIYLAENRGFYGDGSSPPPTPPAGE